MHLVVNKPVQLVIGAKDVIHDVGLAAFQNENGCGARHTNYYVVYTDNHYKGNERGNRKPGFCV